MGTITLIILLAVEMLFLVWSAATKRNHNEERSIVRISEFILLAILLIAGILQWGFRYYMILTVLAVQTVLSVIALVKKNEKPYKLFKNIRGFLRNCFIYTFALTLAILCPQYKQPVLTGNYKISTAKYTWVDESRIETFSKTGEQRAVTVEFWYPENTSGKFPLVVFSHGAFGFGGSNSSTCAELASNGYVVAGISHTYHAFFTSDTNGKLTIVDSDFLNSVIKQSNDMTDKNEAEQFKVSQSWLKLRTDDENFVIDTILTRVKDSASNELFKLIDADKIGLFGHSLGGASSAQLGRERSDISAVIALDGTLLGERLEYVSDSTYILNQTPYPIPLLDIYSGYVYNLAKELESDNYVNFHTDRNAVCSYDVVFKDAGHLNFTDLPLFSPMLAKQLGVGSINSRYCIEKTNELTLEFFNCYLRGGPKPNFEREY